MLLPLAHARSTKSPKKGPTIPNLPQKPSSLLTIFNSSMVLISEAIKSQMTNYSQDHKHTLYYSSTEKGKEIETEMLSNSMGAIIATNLLPP